MIQSYRYINTTAMHDVFLLTYTHVKNIIDGATYVYITCMRSGRSMTVRITIIGRIDLLLVLEIVYSRRSNFRNFLKHHVRHQLLLWWIDCEVTLLPFESLPTFAPTFGCSVAPVIGHLSLSLSLNM
ncbi:hypothetical protein LguiA_004357 [Lonicera macranthoides]